MKRNSNLSEILTLL